MARLPRFCPPGLPQHIIQRGNKRCRCFIDDQDFAAYANWLAKYAGEFEVAIHAWVLMPNHVHLLATPSAEVSISLMMQALGRRYVKYFNETHHRSGTLWEGRFRSSTVPSDPYVLACYRYIELNPVRAHIVEHPADYAWSSYRTNAFGGESSLCSPHDTYVGLGRNTETRQSLYRSLVEPAAPSKTDHVIAQALNKGLALGDEQFSTQLGATYRKRVTPAKLGRPRK